LLSRLTEKRKWEGLGGREKGGRILKKMGLEGGSCAKDGRKQIYEAEKGRGGANSCVVERRS